MHVSGLGLGFTVFGLGFNSDLGSRAYLGFRVFGLGWLGLSS